MLGREGAARPTREGGPLRAVEEGFQHGIGDRGGVVAYSGTVGLSLLRRAIGAGPQRGSATSSEISMAVS
jgi:hypothetical protein